MGPWVWSREASASSRKGPWDPWWWLGQMVHGWGPGVHIHTWRLACRVMPCDSSLREAEAGRSSGQGSGQAQASHRGLA